MATNSLTGELVLRRVYDPATESLKTTGPAETQTEISISSADGDSITTVPNAALVSTTTEISAVGMKTAELYVEAEAVADSAKIQISPVDSGNVWMDVATSTVAADPADLKSSGPKAICARRIRIAIVSGTPVCHLVVQAV